MVSELLHSISNMGTTRVFEVEIATKKMSLEIDIFSQSQNVVVVSCRVSVNKDTTMTSSSEGILEKVIDVYLVRVRNCVIFVIELI